MNEEIESKTRKQLPPYFRFMRLIPCSFDTSFMVSTCTALEPTMAKNPSLNLPWLIPEHVM